MVFVLSCLCLAILVNDLPRTRTVGSAGAAVASKPITAPATGITATNPANMIV